MVNLLFRTGVMRARKITLVERAPPKRFTGIVTAMKESFGFIERADLVKEVGTLFILCNCVIYSKSS